MARRPLVDLRLLRDPRIEPFPPVIEPRDLGLVVGPGHGGVRDPPPSGVDPYVGEQAVPAPSGSAATNAPLTAPIDVPTTMSARTPAYGFQHKSRQLACNRRLGWTVIDHVSRYEW